jgi:hypothetical protein
MEVFSEFDVYLCAVDGVTEMGDIHKGGCEYFDKMPPVLLENFEETFAKHTKNGEHCRPPTDHKDIHPLASSLRK